MSGQAAVPQPQPSLRRPTLLLLGLAVLVSVAYIQPRLALALVVVGSVLVVTWRRPFWAFAGLLALLPLHEQMLRIVTWQLGWPSSWITLLSLWKEGVLGLLVVVLVIRYLVRSREETVLTGRQVRVKVYHFDLWLLALILLAAAYVAVAASVGIGAFGLRNYFEPVLVLYLARFLPYSRPDLKRLLMLLGVVAVAVAAFGIYQARFIDFATMTSMGYVDEFGNLPYAFKTALRDGDPRPRAISTVTGPNQLAIYLNLFILLCAYGFVLLGNGTRPGYRSSRLGPRVVLGGILGLFALCLLLTYSRGGLLALLVSLAAWASIVVYERGIRRTWRELAGNPLVLAGLVVLILGSSGGLLASGFAKRILRGLTGQDPAAQGHLVSMTEAVGFIAEHPLGIGMGMAGPRALRFVGEAQIEHTESTYLQFGMETGLVGISLLLLVLLSLLATLWRLRQRARHVGDRDGQIAAELALVAWAGALAVFTVTPLMQNFLVASHLWVVAGFAFHLDAYRSSDE